MSRALKGVAGVQDVSVDLGQRTATVTHAGADVEAMKVAVDDAGYEVAAVE